MTDKKRRVLQLVSEWDPANLMSHAPDDEYEHEVDEILVLAMSDIDADQLGVAIREIFVHQFGADRFATPTADCIKVAQRILRIVRA